LAGIKDEITFKQRNGILKMVYISKIPTDFDLPEFKRYKAYGIFLNSNLNDRVINISDLCINSETYLEFLEQIEVHDLTEHWDFIKVYDNPDIKFKAGYKRNQDLFDYSDPEAIAKFLQVWDDISTDPAKRTSALNYEISYFARAIVNDPITAKYPKDFNGLLQNYDHSLDVHFLCSNYFTGSKIIYKNSPGKNDLLDLCHLMYVKQADKIVTNDKMLLNIMGKVCPDNIISADEFLM
jgi:hypothetical protein